MFDFHYPFQCLQIPNISLFFPIFFVIYLVAYFVVFRNWPPKIRPEASSCMISLAHGTPAVFLAASAIRYDPNRGFASPNTKFENSVLDYSVAYFLMDLLHYLIFYPNDVLFIGHHLCTLFVFLTCRYLVYHGAFPVLVLLILAEVTSLCQNLWTLATLRREDVKFAAKVYDFLSPPFYVLYSIVRGFIGPYFLFQMAQFHLSGVGEPVIPRWIWVSWLAVVTTAIVVSNMWIWNLWLELFRERRTKLEKKKKTT